MPPSLEELSAQAPGSTPELMLWVRSQLEAGHPPQALHHNMQAKGWATPVIHAALAACQAASSQPPLAQHATLGPDLRHHPSDIDVGDRRVQVLLSLQRPHLVLFGNVLSAQECEELIAGAQPAMARSRTVGLQNGGEEVNPDRTSRGMFYARGQTPTVARLEARIAQLLRWPLDHGEGLQVLHYLPGAEYKPHHDYFHPNEASSAAILRRGGQRIGTLVIYLNDVAEGGCTYFPETQLRIHPRQGHAVFFGYPEPADHTLTLHGGDPVIQGEKWIATKWLRERTFQ